MYVITEIEKLSRFSIILKAFSFPLRYQIITSVSISIRICLFLNS